jgi:hypothetical protein
MRPNNLAALIRGVALLVLLAASIPAARAVEPCEAVQGSLQVANKQFPLPRGEWIVVGLGVQSQPQDTIGPFGVIRTAVLIQHSGDRVTALAEFNTNEISLSDGWDQPETCDNMAPDQRQVRYRSRLDASCVFVTTSHIAGGPAAWQQALNYIAGHHLQVAATMLTAAFVVSDRQDFIDARLHFDPADFPKTDAARQILLGWATKVAPEFETGMANRLVGSPLDGPQRSALLSDTPELDRRLLELETLQQRGGITPADALSQQQAAQTEVPRSAEVDSAGADGWYYRVSTPLINLVAAYGVTQSAPLAVAIAVTEHFAHTLVTTANQAAWDTATTEATQHKVPWPVLVHIGEGDKPAPPTS